MRLPKAPNQLDLRRMFSMVEAVLLSILLFYLLTSACQRMNEDLEDYQPTELSIE